MNYIQVTYLEQLKAAIKINIQNIYSSQNKFHNNNADLND